jgi:hypothetical protein
VPDALTALGCGANLLEVTHITLNKLNRALESGKSPGMTARIVIKGNYFVSLLDELTAEGRSQKATAARNEDPHDVPTASSSPA